MFTLNWSSPEPHHIFYLVVILLIVVMWRRTSKQKAPKVKITVTFWRSNGVVAEDVFDYLENFQLGSIITHKGVKYRVTTFRQGELHGETLYMAGVRELSKQSEHE